MYALGRTFILFIAIFLVNFNHCCCSFNSTESTLCKEDLLQRVKRFVNFPINGGGARIIIGVLCPIFFHHNVLRNINAAVNLQSNYAIPAKIVWPVPEKLFKQRVNEDFTDNSRPQLYRLLERMINDWGRDGRTCLLRTICEVAEAPLSHNGVFGEILDVVFTPTEMDGVDHEYKEARQFGLKGGDCSQRYQECPNGDGLLDAITAMGIFQL